MNTNLILNNTISISIDSPFGIFLTYIYLFMIGSVIGYLIEVLFRRFVSMKKWINPGFLKGPYLPLYGFGTCILYLFTNTFFKYLVLDGTYPTYYSIYTTQGNLNFYLVGLIVTLVIGIAMTLLELIGGLIFVKGLHIKLWDYSNLKGNFKGLICPLFSFIWTLIGALYYFLIHPFIYQAVVIFNNHIWVMTFFLGIFFATFFIDLYQSVKLSINLNKIAKKETLVIDFEKFKLNLKSKENKSKKLDTWIEAAKKANAPINNKIKEISTNLKKHLYINNELPSKSNDSETPRMKEERINKGNNENSEEN